MYEVEALMSEVGVLSPEVKVLGSKVKVWGPEVGAGGRRLGGLGTLENTSPPIQPTSVQTEDTSHAPCLASVASMARVTAPKGA